MPPSPTFARSLAPLVNLVFPPRCPLCGEGLAAQGGLCGACWGELVIPGAPCCSLCQRPFGDGVVAGSICAPCLAAPPRHDGIAAGTLYNDASRRLVLAFKHGRRIALAPMMARLIAARMVPLTPETLIVPVPLHRWRLWRRGFNQAALLAREIARLRGGRVVVDLLQRRKATPSLGGLGRQARARALAGTIAIDARRLATVRGADVLLVDDVLTSGATSNACVSVLKRAGAKRVTIACFARVLDEALDHAAADHAAASSRSSNENAGDIRPALSTNENAGTFVPPSPPTKTPGTFVPGAFVTKLCRRCVIAVRRSPLSIVSPNPSCAGSCPPLGRDPAP